MTLSGPPMPRSVEHPRTADELRESRKFWIAIWTPTSVMLASIVVGLLGVWKGCSSVSSDVASIKSSLEARDKEIISIRNRVTDVEDTAGKARKEAGDAIAKARRNESRIDKIEPVMSKPRIR